ncbi:hypothetical protein IHE33_07995 [Mycetohabitans endofungorum]
MGTQPSLGPLGKSFAPVHRVTGHRLAVPRALFLVQVQARRGQRHVPEVVAYRAQIEVGVGLMRAGRMPQSVRRRAHQFVGPIGEGGPARVATTRRRERSA